MVSQVEGRHNLTFREHNGCRRKKGGRRTIGSCCQGIMTKHESIQEAQEIHRNEKQEEYYYNTVLEFPDFFLHAYFAMYQRQFEVGTHSAAITKDRERARERERERKRERVCVSVCVSIELTGKFRTQIKLLLFIIKHYVYHNPNRHIY